MKKNLLLILLLPLLPCVIQSAQQPNLILPENEGLWGWIAAPFRGVKHAFMGYKVGQSFWEANASHLNSLLAEFKAATTDQSRINILNRVLTQSSHTYQSVVTGLQNNYRQAMSYIMEQFQDACHDSTIMYLPDNRRVTLIPKTASDAERIRLIQDMINPVQQAPNTPVNPQQQRLTQDIEQAMQNALQRTLQEQHAMRQGITNLQQIIEQAAQRAIQQTLQHIPIQPIVPIQQAPKNPPVQQTSQHRFHGYPGFDDN